MDFVIQYGADIGLIILLAAEVIWHVHKGFMRTVLMLIAAILAFGVALKIAEPIASWSYDTFFHKAICEKIEERMPDLADAQNAKEVVDGVTDVIPEYLSNILKKNNIDLNEIGEKIGSAASEGPLTPEQISQKIVKPAAMVVLKTVCTLLCYGVLMALFHVLIHLLCLATKLPVLHSADKLLGGILGFLKGLMLVYLIAMLCGLIGQVTKKPKVKQFIEQSRIVTAVQQLESSMADKSDQQEEGVI